MLQLVEILKRPSFEKFNTIGFGASAVVVLHSYDANVLSAFCCCKTDTATSPAFLISADSHAANIKGISAIAK